MDLKVPPSPVILFYSVTTAFQNSSCNQHWCEPCYRGAGRKSESATVNFHTEGGYNLGNGFHFRKGRGEGKLRESLIQVRSQLFSLLEWQILSRERMLPSEDTLLPSWWPCDKFSVFPRRESCLFHWLYLCKSQSDLPWNPVTAASHSRIDLFL